MLKNVKNDLKIWVCWLTFCLKDCIIKEKEE